MARAFIGGAIFGSGAASTNPSLSGNKNIKMTQNGSIFFNIHF